MVTTEESTPPERALIAIPSPTAAIISLTFAEMNLSVFRSFAFISSIIATCFCFKLTEKYP
jgi:hypothetical protein